MVQGQFSMKRSDRQGAAAFGLVRPSGITGKHAREVSIKKAIFSKGAKLLRLPAFPFCQALLLVEYPAEVTDGNKSA
jgi:hypothetical protein